MGNVNLRDFDNSGYWDKFWRVRIDMLRIVLLDSNGGYIESPGLKSNDDIQVRVTTQHFSMTRTEPARYLFLAQDFVCTSEYSSQDNSDPQFRSQCEIDESIKKL